MKIIRIFAILGTLCFVTAQARASSSYEDMFIPSQNNLVCQKNYFWSNQFVIKWNIGLGSFKKIAYEHRSNFTSIKEYSSQSECQGRINEIASSFPITLEYEVDIHHLKPFCVYESVKIFFLENFESSRNIMNDCAAH